MTSLMLISGKRLTLRYRTIPGIGTGNAPTKICPELRLRGKSSFGITFQNDRWTTHNRQVKLALPFSVLWCLLTDFISQQKYSFGIMDHDAQSLHARRKLLPGCGQRGEASQEYC
jgi:hypothetical protein